MRNERNRTDPRAAAAESLISRIPLVVRALDSSNWPPRFDIGPRPERAGGLSTLGWLFFGMLIAINTLAYNVPIPEFIFVAAVVDAGLVLATLLYWVVGSMFGHGH